MFAYMKVHCPICCCEMDGMKAYGRESHCCGPTCHNEWEWRRTLAIMGKPYKPDPRRFPGEESPVEAAAEPKKGG